MNSTFDEIARPIWFEHDDPIYSIWVKGSSFICADAKHFYWVTAAHVLTNTKADPQSLRIFSSDSATTTLSFDEKYTLTETDARDDYRDIFILRVDDEEFSKCGDSALIGQDIQDGFLDVDSLPLGSELWIVGYADDDNYVDYEQAKIKQTRSVVRAIYQGQGVSDYCHTARVESSIKLSSFDGLSGSPVFYKRIDGGEERMVLAGMLIRGTANSLMVHFINAAVIRRMIELIPWA